MMDTDNKPQVLEYT